MTAVATKYPTLHHVTLKTTRLDEMIDWYGNAVGMTANFKFPGGAWTSNDEANHRVAFLTVPGLDDDEVDPEKMVTAWRDGADAAELHRLGHEERAFDSESPLDLRLPAEARRAR